MTEEAALDLQLTRNVFGRALSAREPKNSEKLADMAEQVMATSPATRRLRDRVRIAPDGLGRLAARIEPAVLRAALDAVSQDRKLKFFYTSAAGKPSTPLLSPLGLVAKDGTIYLVAVKGLTDAPRHFPLHRISSAELHFQHAQSRPDFDLQDYIEKTHQFSHVLDADAPPIRLELRVAPETLYHFFERPLSGNQTVTPPGNGDTWYRVTATLPRTVLLVPFLVGMGRWIEVLAPSELRAETTEWIGGMWAHYSKS